MTATRKPSRRTGRPVRVPRTSCRTLDRPSHGAGQRQGQTVGAATLRYKSYALDAQGSVEGLETDNGTLPASDRYHYNPYGELDGPGASDPEAGLSDEAKANPFRFQGHYYDAGIKTYDMQARSYRPDLGQFLSEDRFEAAGLDLSLQADPLTQNRYAFAGGNPVSRIEFDGHFIGYNDQPKYKYHVRDSRFSG
jgi:RHS repeat-associated protein